MPRRIFGALAPALLALAASASIASAHGGGSQDYISRVQAIPDAPGVSVTVLDRDDRLLLKNRGRDTVTVFGYNREPYARIQPGGRVQVNERSPALYLNDDRFGQVSVPKRANADAAPQWKTLDGTGSFEWHDHRMHWMSKTKPAKVTDEGKRTKIFDWRVPVRVDSQPAAIRGDLFWVGQSGGGFPVGAGIALAVIVLGGIALVVVVRRRRRAPGEHGGGASGEVAEAW